MLYPEVNKMTNDKVSRYALVIAVAKHARLISEEAERNGEHLKETAVKLSINDFATHKISIIKRGENIS